jgi:hypothetical protein
MSVKNNTIRMQDKVSFSYVPTERCTIDQTLKNAELIGGIDVEEDAEAYWFGDREAVKTSLVLLQVENGWVKSGEIRSYGKAMPSMLRPAPPLHTLPLSSLTNCDWAGEDEERYGAYQHWTEEERLAQAKESAQQFMTDVVECQIARDGTSEHGNTTLEKEIEKELKRIAELREQYGVPDELPLAKPLPVARADQKKAWFEAR